MLCCRVVYLVGPGGVRWGGDELRKFWGGFLVGGKVVELRDQSFWVLAGWLGGVSAERCGGWKTAGRKTKSEGPPPWHCPSG